MQIEGKWDDLKGRIKQEWGSLTDDELTEADGDMDRLIGTIKQKTGQAEAAIEARLETLVRRLD